MQLSYNGVVRLMVTPSLPARIHDSAEDEVLLAWLADGDNKAFAELVTRHTDKFYRIAFKILCNKSDAEDVVQDAFLKLWQHPNLWSEQKKTKFTTWFYRVITNRCIDMKRKKLPMQMHEDFDIKQEKLLEDELYKKQQRQLLNTMLDKLPERQRIAVGLCYQEELPHKEAAAIMEVSIKALESLLMRAKSALKEEVLRLERK